MTPKRDKKIGHGDEGSRTIGRVILIIGCLMYLFFSVEFPDKLKDCVQNPQQFGHTLARDCR